MSATAKAAPLGRWRLRSLRSRIVASFLAAASVALVLALAACALGLQFILMTTAQGSARSQAQQVSQEVSRSSDPAAALREAASSTQVVQVFDGAGRVVATTQPGVRHPVSGPDAGTHRTRLEVAGDDDHYIVVTQATKDASGRSWWVAAATPIEQNDTIIKATVGLLAGAALVLLVVTAWGIHRVVGRALRPVDAIRADVDRIRSSRSDVRVTVPQTGDEIERLAATMNRMLDRLDAADDAQRAFISDASHELRSPLTTIRLLTETDPDGGETSQLVHVEALRMQALVDDMLALAKADDAGALQRGDVDLDALAHDEMRRVRQLGPSVTGHLDAVRVDGDDARLAQVVRNLADNAMRHAAGEVRFATFMRGDEAVLQVDNDGAPVPVADREAVFGRFVRLDAARDRDAGGSGLGLAISRALVEAHGGALSADEAPDGWCRFEVRLPVRQTSERIR